jgi:hypothetical protein
MLLFSNRQINNTNTKRPWGGGGGFHEQNVHLEVGIELDNGGTEHVFYIYKKPKRKGGVIEHTEVRLPWYSFNTARSNIFFYKNE